MASRRTFESSPRFARFNHRHAGGVLFPVKSERCANDAEALFQHPLSIAGWLEVARGTVLPRDRRLFGLLDQTLEAHFRSA